MPIALPVRLLMIASVALVVAAVDWVLKAYALEVPSGSMWSPADLFLVFGMVLLWIGAVRARGRPAVVVRRT
jgi:hypothetical protein